MADESIIDQPTDLPTCKSVKRIRRKYDHKLTPEEIKEVKRESWRKWYHEKGGKEKRREKAKLDQRKKAEMYKFYKQQYEENQKLNENSK